MPKSFYLLENIALIVLSLSCLKFNIKLIIIEYYTCVSCALEILLNKIFKMRNDIVMVDLNGQYQNLKKKIDSAIDIVIQSGKFINGPEVELFSKELARWIGVKHVIPCANGTDALQLAIMALQLKVGDEVLVPSFSYVATVEVIVLLGLKPVFVDVNPHTFTIDVVDLRNKITEKSKLIIPVHLFGQCANMEIICKIAQKYQLKIVEDTAQAIGACYRFSNGETINAGAIGDFGTTSFFPSKNLGCFGDGGALLTNSDDLAIMAKMMANHGQKVKYHHDVIGCNSRLDTIQAAILRVKLQYLREFTAKRKRVAMYYRKELNNVKGLAVPNVSRNSTHVYNQFTLKIDLSDRYGIQNIRDRVQTELRKRGIPTMIYYPLPIHLQKAYCSQDFPHGSLPMTERLSESVLSIPIHTEMTDDEMEYITESIKEVMKRILVHVSLTTKKTECKEIILSTNQQ